MLIDCQGLKSSGTGRHDILVEIAWSILDPETCHESVKFEAIVRPHNLLSRRELRRIHELCGINPCELASGMGETEVAQEFRRAVETFQPESIVVHFASFERPFLERLWHSLDQGVGLSVPLVCTRDLARKLLPRLGAYSLKAVAGFFGGPPGTLKRAGSHVQATRIIWEGLERLRPDAQAASSLRPAGSLRSQRLGLPAQPGTYRFFDASGQLLYVGKATSLKDRVNSYFRGGVRQDPRKREMMAQVKHLEVFLAPTPLHAALDEFRVITSCMPPYNVMLNREDRGLFWLDRMTLEPVPSPRADAIPLMGPFVSADTFLDLRLLSARASPEFLFQWPVQQEEFDQGLALAIEVLRLSPEESLIPRAWLRAGVLAGRGAMPFQAFGEIEDSNILAVEDAREAEPCMDPVRVKRSILRKVKRSAERWFQSVSVKRLAGRRLVFHGTSDDEWPSSVMSMKLPHEISTRHAFQELAIVRAELKADPRWSVLAGTEHLDPL